MRLRLGRGGEREPSGTRALMVKRNMADPVAQVTPTPPTPVWVLPGLAIIILLIYAGSLAAVCFLNNDTLRTSMFGSVPVVVMAAINYYFGSSAGSAKKDDQSAVTNANAIAALATSTPPPTAPVTTTITSTPPPGSDAPATTTTTTKPTAADDLHAAIAETPPHTT